MIETVINSEHSESTLIQSILASDLAADIGREVAELHAFGLEMSTITQRIVETFADALRDPQHGPVVIVALAAAQLRERDLFETIREAALSLIDSGEAADAFAADHAELRTQRRALLEQFADLLRSHEGESDADRSGSRP